MGKREEGDGFSWLELEVSWSEGYGDDGKAGHLFSGRDRWRCYCIVLHNRAGDDSQARKGRPCC